MIKTLQKIGNSKGLVLDKALLDLLDIGEDTSIEIKPTNGGLLLKKVDVKSAYEIVASKHRKSLDKLAK